MKKSYPLISFYAGILTVICYLVFTLLAFRRYPLPYSPTSNWLSDLGNPDLNPQGAGFYNLGIVLTAVLLSLFFVGLVVWKIENKSVQIGMLYLAQACGIFGGWLHNHERDLPDQQARNPLVLVYSFIHPAVDRFCVFSNRLEIPFSCPQGIAHPGDLNRPEHNPDECVHICFCAGMDYSHVVSQLYRPGRD